jgi:membrane protein implicated in regulation of membrane protease activity
VLFLVWVVAAVALVLFEMHHLAFYAMFLAAGCLAAAGVALVAPGALAAQVGIGIAVTAVGVVAVRPAVSRQFQSRHQGHLVRGVAGGLVGVETVTLDVVGEAPHVGHVRVAGERWLATSGGGHSLPPGTRVVVMGVEGTTLEVWPVGDVLPELEANGGT